MPHLIGTRLVLREYQWEDLPHIREWVNDDEITRNLHDVFLFPNTLFDTESFLRMMIEGKSGSKGFIISDKDTQSYIGQIDLHQIDYRNSHATLGIVIGKKIIWKRLWQGSDRSIDALCLQRFESQSSGA
jgi:RimJ/RimL family protein N-acetyltransferase